MAGARKNRSQFGRRLLSPHVTPLRSHMKLRTLLILATITVFTAVAPQAFSAGKRGAAAKAKDADPFETSESAPAKKLAPYIEHLDQILALRRAPAFDRVPGKLAVLKQSFTARQSTAEGAEKTALAAAVVTCDRLAAALDERQKTLAQITASTAVKGSDDLGERRKDSLTKDIRPGYGRGRAAEVELARERKEANEARREAAEKDQAMTARSVQRWTDRSAELRKQITEAFNKIPSM
jgi:hypothetical protein